MPPAYEILLLNTTIPQIQAAQSGDTYLCPRELAVVVNSATDAVRITQTGTGNALLVEDSANPDSTPFVVTAAGDVGIGTSSPAYALDVTQASGSPSIRVLRTASAGADMRIVSSALATGGIVGTYSASPVLFYADSAEKMRLDTSGNLGLGVTPSAWNSVYKAFQFGTTGALHGESGEAAVYLACNAFINSAGLNKYITTDFATRYNQENGVHKWLIAASGTAGDTISFTQAMTLDADGDLGIGITNPTAKLDMASGAGAAVNAIRVRSVSTNTNGFNIVTDSTTDNIFLNNFYNAAMLFGTNNTERARITSGGDLLVGTTTSYGRLTVQTDGTNGAVGFVRNTDNAFATDLDFIKSRGSTASPTAVQDGDGLLRLRTAPYQGSAYTYLNAMAVQVDGTFTSGQNPPTRILWYTNAANGSATERARITSGGDLLVGTTTNTNSYRAVINGDLALRTDTDASGTTTLRLCNSTSMPQGIASVAGVKTAAGTGYLTLGTADGGVGPSEKVRITSGGLFQVSSGGSVQVGGTAARATTAGTNRLDIFNGTAPVGTLTNGISIYSSSGEAYVMDAAGNATLFSPHDAETNEWIFKSKHTPTGKVLKIDVERLLKFVNDHFGLDAVHEFVEE